MRNRLIIDGNAVYEIDEECMNRKQVNTGTKNSTNMGSYTGQNRQGKNQTDR